MKHVMMRFLAVGVLAGSALPAFAQIPSAGDMQQKLDQEMAMNNARTRPL